MPPFCLYEAKGRLSLISLNGLFIGNPTLTGFGLFVESTVGFMRSYMYPRYLKIVNVYFE
jgi:hypothetical protein